MGKPTLKVIDWDLHLDWLRVIQKLMDFEKERHLVRHLGKH